jgi:hypothetical protein
MMEARTVLERPEIHSILTQLITREIFIAFGYLTKISNLMLFENRVLRRIFGPKRVEVIGGWRKLHNE